MTSQTNDVRLNVAADGDFRLTVVTLGGLAERSRIN